jgi:GNAT superfamily N-acetyltransferase
VASLRIQLADTDKALADWRHVHNVIIPADALTTAEVHERAGRNFLEVAYLGDQLIGCSTVRPPADNSSTATVIARVLPEWRRRGFGEQIYASALVRAEALDADHLETVVWAANGDGLRFAQTHGFAEVDRYVLDGADIAYITLRLPT